MKKKSLLNSTAVVMAVILITKLVGLFRDVVLANYFGTSNISDAYLIAISIPTQLFWFVGHALSTAYMPMYNKVLAARGAQAAKKYTDNILTVSLLISCAIATLIAIFPEAIIKVYAAGFDDATVAITATYLRIGAPTILFMTFINVFGGYLNTKGDYIITVAISLPRNALLIISIITASILGYTYLGWGILGAYVAEFLFLLPFVIRQKYLYRPEICYDKQYLKDTLYLVLPILLGMIVSQINKIVDRSMASMITVGGLSAISYASIINNSVQEVLVTGIITILFSQCSKMVAAGQTDAVKAKLSKTINVLILFLIPASFGIWVLSDDLVSVVLCRGEFDAWSLATTSGALKFYTIGLLFFSIRDCLVKIFYAYKDTKLTTAISTIAIALNIILNFALYNSMGLNGLALATSISAIFSCVTLYVFMTKKIGNFGIARTSLAILKSLLSSAVMVALILVAREHTAVLNDFVELVVCFAIGVLTYGVCIGILNIKYISKRLIKR